AAGLCPGPRNWGVLAPLCLLLLLLLTLGASYKPVVVVHGLFDSPSVFSQLLRFINQVSPDAWVPPRDSWVLPGSGRGVGA
uniref:Palmitoyl-protein thioesterase 2 n=1 Tax=Terrapene triunguis TaxID=2587831 RepID=A0A674K405_9SAUR